MLLTASGALYHQVIETITLNNPIFMKSYYETYIDSMDYKIVGLVFVCLSIVLLLLSIMIFDIDSFNQSTFVIQIIQMIGLTRIKQFPIIL